MTEKLLKTSFDLILFRFSLLGLKGNHEQAKKKRWQALPAIVNSDNVTFSKLYLFQTDSVPPQTHLDK